MIYNDNNNLDYRFLNNSIGHARIFVKIFRVNKRKRIKKGII